MDEAKRISLDAFPELVEEVEKILDDPERIKASGVHRKTFRRLLDMGLPMYFEPFTKDAGLARALCVALERKAA